jgi:hypothetical protein
VRHGIAVESVAGVAEVGADMCGVEVVVGEREGGGWWGEPSGDAELSSGAQLGSRVVPWWIA